MDVLAEVDQNYVRELSDAQKKKLVEDMINGGLDRLDPHSEYLNDEEFKQFETQSEGSSAASASCSAWTRRAVLKVESPMPGTPPTRPASWPAT